MAKDMSNIREEYSKAYSNYRKRYNYAKKKFGVNNMPPMEENLSKLNKNISKRQILELNKMNIGYFESFGEKEEEKISIEDLWHKYISISEVDLYYNAFLDIPNQFNYHATSVIFKVIIDAIDSEYPKEAIAFIMRDNYDIIQKLVNDVLKYENDYYTNPVTQELANELRLLFANASIPDEIIEALIEDAENGYDRDFDNAGDMGEYEEDDFR